MPGSTVLLLVVVAFVLADIWSRAQAVPGRPDEKAPGLLRRFLDWKPSPLDLKVAFDLAPIRDVSSNLLFRAPTIDDRPVLHEIMSDPDVVAAHRLSPDGQAVWKRLIDDPEISAWRRAEWLVAVERESDEIVGLATVGPVPEGHSGLSVGLMMRAGYRRSGYGTQLAAAMITVLQHTFLYDVWAFTSPDNEGVLTILERLGYKPEADLVTVERANGNVDQVLAYRCGRGEGPPDASVWA